MSPIDPVDINTHIAQNLNASKIKDIQDAKEHGVSQFPEVLKKDEEHEKTSIKKIESTENNNIDADAQNKNEQEEKQRQEKEKKEHEEKMNKLKNLFGDAKLNRGGSIDIKL
jgi:hypothetical protein